ncbi:tyrosine-protein phosphatase [Kitasatospora sp. NPDC036755]|uniref:tyrosine-protein phosphatase n=1 Tax=Kitasatospora sp. NPDC036755 TaxID=3154600 RepID=UPI0033DE5E83
MVDQHSESGGFPSVRNASPEPRGTPLVGRGLGLRGAPNARDPVGRRAVDGRIFRRGVALRGDGLNHVTATAATAAAADDDDGRLGALGLRGAVDPRSTGEVRATGPDARSTA